MSPLEYVSAGIATFVVTGLLGILWRHGTAITRKLTKLEYILTGADGKNGVRGNVEQIIRDLNEVKDEHSEMAVWQKGIEMQIAQSDKEHAALTLRVTLIEKVA